MAGTSWSAPATVAGFVQSPPNARLLQVAGREWRPEAHRLLDIGCGAGRNALPLARARWDVLACDLSWAMLTTARARAAEEQLEPRLRFVLASMEALPAADETFDVIVAHGIWNLARSAREFRSAVREAGRVAKPGAALFVFTFSRTTLPAEAETVPGEPFVFTQFSGQPQCFLTADQLVEELGAAGFEPDPRDPLLELNRPRPGMLPTSRSPVIYEGVFRKSG